MNEPVTSRQNQTVSHVVKLLSQSRYRRETGLFAAEGTKLLDDAVQAGVEIDTVLVSEGVTVAAGGARVVTLSSRLFGSISTQRSPQGAIFAATRPSHTLHGGRLIVLDGVQDPGNVGSVIRTAAALGMDGVILTGGCADSFSHKVVRASMGGVFRIAVCECKPEDVVRYIGDRQLAAAILESDNPVGSTDLGNLVPVVGSEGGGISDRMLAICTTNLTIPMAGNTESLGAAAAAAIIMWEQSRKD